jgi:hypothetical protein
MTALWTIEQANAWYARQPWLVGANFTPSSAANQLEFWQADTYDIPTIQRELGWAADIGMNSMRVFLHDLAWCSDPAGFLARLDHFLDLSAALQIRPLLVFFDDCWNPNPVVGAQAAPLPGVHNSRWWQSPGKDKVNDPASWPLLGEYVQAVLARFAQDERVLGWDLYNEPGNQGQENRSLPFLTQVFAWARAVAITQPLTCGVWKDSLTALNSYQLANSDVISFHNYGPPAELAQAIALLKPLGRPLLCTEYMARKSGSLFTTNLPLLKAEHIAAYNWGLVDGKTQTKFAWNTPQPGLEPDPWFHEVFQRDGSAYRDEEVRAIRALTAA